MFVNGQQVDSIIQTFFIPLPEEDLLFQSFDLIKRRADAPIRTLISIAIAADNTMIFYDHWEDGYVTTEIWGDGDVSNGAPPGVTTNTGDVLRGGQAIVVENDIPVPRGNGIDCVDPATSIPQNCYDGKDRIRATLPITITRSAYPAVAGSLMAGAVEVLDVDSWGTEFIAPVGEDTPDTSATNPFETTKLFIMAGFDGTTVTHPISKGNSTTTTRALNRGENFVISVNQGDEVTSDRPIQVDLLAGDASSNYELRWFTQVDRKDWSNEYYSPVAQSSGRTGFWFYNPNDAAIMVNVEGGNLENENFDFPVPSKTAVFRAAHTDSGSNIRIQTTNGGYTGLRFSSQNSEPFYALVQVDADGDGRHADWGFALIPSQQLTSQALVGLGRACTNVTGNACNGNETSVVWVTPVENAVVFVDYDGDGNFDRSFVVDRLDSLRLTDVFENDEDMSGATIAAFAGRTGGTNPGVPSGATINIALAWGQDPTLADSVASQDQEMDLGTLVLPIRLNSASKRVVKVENPDGSEDPMLIVDQVGDVIFYEISVSNVGYSDFSAVAVDDTLIEQFGSGLTGPDKTVSGIGNGDAILSHGEKWVYTGTYTVSAADIATKGGGDGRIENVAIVTIDNLPSVTVDVETPIFLAIISGAVMEDTNNGGTGDVTSGDTPLEGVKIELLDGNGSIIATTETDSTGFYEFVNLEAGDYFVRQQNKVNFVDVDDFDHGVDLSFITVANVTGGNEYLERSFVDYRPSPSSSPSVSPSDSLSPSSMPSLEPSASPSSVPTGGSSSSPTNVSSNSPSESFIHLRSSLSSEFPSSIPTASPVSIRASGSTLLPTAFCKEATRPNCTLCAPYRSLGKLDVLVFFEMEIR